MHVTLRQSVRFSGVGLHGGQPATVEVCPAPAGHGIAFLRTDVPEGRGLIPARHDHACDLKLCTKLRNKAGVSVGTVEHLMAALAGSGVSDALIRIDGPEVPIMDGSARAFVEGLRKAGLRELGRTRHAIKVLEPVVVEHDGKRAALMPADAVSLAFRIEFDDPAIGEQMLELDLTGGAFADSLADCRTFGHLAEVEQLRQMGLARGGSLQNAIVVDRGRILNPEGLRREDEFVRHKMLDATGDLALAGAPLIARYEGDKAGHEMTNRLLHALFARPEAWMWVEADPRVLPDLRRAGAARPSRARPIAV